MDTEQMLYEIVNRIGKKQDEMAETLIRIEDDVRYHIRRTDIIEAKLFINWKTVSAVSAILASTAAAIYYLTKVL